MRILFSIETDDKWILNAYLSFFRTVNNYSGFEVFATVNGCSKSWDFLYRYNIINYGDLHWNLVYSAERMSRFAKLDKSKLGKYALWSTPENLLSNFYLWKTVYDYIEPDLVILWNGITDIRGVICEYLKQKNKKFFYAEKGLLPNTFYIDPKGILADSVIDKSFISAYSVSEAKLKDTERYIRNIISVGESGWEQPSRKSVSEIKRLLGITIHDKVIFFPGQVDSDVNIIRYSPFNKVVEALQLLLERIPPNLKVVFKVHPKADKKQLIHVNKLKEYHNNLILVDDINIYDLLEISDITVSINSTVALESLFSRKKAFLLGDSLLVNAGVLEKVEIENFSSILDCYLNNNFEQIFDWRYILKFISVMKNKYYFSLSDNNFPKYAYDLLHTHTELLPLDFRLQFNGLYKDFGLLDKIISRFYYGMYSRGNNKEL